jgi:hypothetical protein
MMRPMSFGHGGPEWGPGGSSTPDWAALAERAEQDRKRRRRWFLLGGGGLAAVAVAGIVAVAVVNESGDTGASDEPSKSLPSSEDPPVSGQPDPTFKDDPPPPPPPRDFVSDPERDKAPLNARTLYPGGKATVHGRTYTKHATDASGDCADAANPDLGAVLDKHDCEKLYRATYTRQGLVFSVGIAVFRDTSRAARVKDDYEPNLMALPGRGVPDFCRTVTCRTTANDFGRYAYFTIAGRTDGKPSTGSDKKAVQAARDGSDFAYARILQRGKDQAKAAVTGSPD